MGNNNITSDNNDITSDNIVGVGSNNARVGDDDVGNTTISSGFEAQGVARIAWVVVIDNMVGLRGNNVARRQQQVATSV